VRDAEKSIVVSAQGGKSVLKNSMLIRAFDTREVAYMEHVGHEGHGLRGMYRIRLNNLTYPMGVFKNLMNVFH